MKRFQLLLIDVLYLIVIASVIALFMLLTSRAHGGGEWAVVRIPSHGGSGTVIKNTKPSLILTSAHMFQGADASKKIVLDVPSPPGTAPISPGVKLIGITGEARDLALLQVEADLPYVCPVAPVGYQIKKPMSVGYDEMQTPYKVRPVTILRDDQYSTYTRERPWHGRWGGALVDGNYLVGVVTGFTVPCDRFGREDKRGHTATELYPGSEGKYVNLATIRAFLAAPTGRQSYQQFSPPRPPDDYWLRPQRQNYQPSPRMTPGPGQYCPDGTCPGGVCPPLPSAPIPYRRAAPSSPT